MSVPDGPFVPKTDVIETRLADEIILLDTATQQMFSLTGSGPLIWDALRTETISGVAALITARFEVTPEVATADVRALVTRLLDAGLLGPRADGH
jgi:hypothetical protein